MAVNIDTRRAERLGENFEIFGRTSVKLTEKVPPKVMKNPEKRLEKRQKLPLQPHLKNLKQFYQLSQLFGISINLLCNLS